jgi:peptidoglycan/xylan/chitin deacetylase (PgdA/CDA1 family)
VRAILERGTGGIRTHWCRRQFGPRALVLAYHRIAEPDADPLGLCVSPGHFAEHLEVLHAYGEPIRLDHLPHALERRAPAREAVCVTLDDGYADNLYVAAPLLQRYDVPATVFVVSGQHAMNREFWWDEVGRLMLHSRPLPATPLPPELGLPEDTASALQPDRTALFEAIHDRLYDLPTSERDAHLECLRGWLGVPLAVRSTHATLSPNEILRLTEGGLIEIGAHTATHPRLDRLTEEEQSTEIRESKRHLEAVLDREVTSFAYPHGRFTPRTPALVAETGFARACTVVPGAVWRESDPWRLPRLLVSDVDGDGLARRLRAWFGRPPVGVRHA